MSLRDMPHHGRSRFWSHRRGRMTTWVEGMSDIYTHTNTLFTHPMKPLKHTSALTTSLKSTRNIYIPGARGFYYKTRVSGSLRSNFVSDPLLKFGDLTSIIAPAFEAGTIIKTLGRKEKQGQYSPPLHVPTTLPFLLG